MKLLIDFGNSRCKWATSENGCLQSGAAEVYDGTHTPAVIENLMARLPIQQSRQIHVVSVLGSEFDQEFVQQVAGHAEVEIIHYVSQREAFGVRLVYDDPASYGADRYAALVAAYHSGEGAKIVVDCGTAVTVDAINEQGMHLGGLIIPGVELMCSMLAENTTGISRSDAITGVEYLNTSTHDSVVSGSTLCLRHGLHSIIAKIQQKIEQHASIYVTGGASTAIIEMENDQIFERPDLVLEGLQIMQSS